MSTLFRQQCKALAAGLQTLPDKPQETVAATLKVLWHLTPGRPLSIEAADEAPLMPLDDAGRVRLAELIAQRLAHLSGRQRFMWPKMLAGLKPGVWVAFEIGLRQGPAVLKRLQAGGAVTQTRRVADAQGEIRCLLAGL